MSRRVHQNFEDLTAKYKVEIVYGHGRTAEGPNAYWLLVWSSSGLLAAEGDTLLGFCPSCKLNVITRQPELTFCQKCKSVIKEEEVADRVLFKTTTSVLSGMLVQLFYQLDGLVDVYLKFHPLDIRYSSTDVNKETVKKLNTARSGRVPSVYTLQRILEDTQEGRADLRDRFKAFLRA